MLPTKKWEYYAGRFYPLLLLLPSLLLVSFHEIPGQGMSPHFPDTPRIQQRIHKKKTTSFLNKVNRYTIYHLNHIFYIYIYN